MKTTNTAFEVVILVVLIFIGSMTLSGQALAVTIGWPTAVVAQSGTFLTGEPNVVLGPPSGAVTQIRSSESATYGGFDDAVSYDDVNLAAAFGISLAQLAAADIFLFDFNGSALGFEAAVITIDDGTTSVPVNHGGTAALPVAPAIVNGSMPIATFNALFGTSLASGFVGFLLFDADLAGIDPFAQGLTVQVVGGGLITGADTPDLMGLGVVGRVPEPTTASLLAVGLLGIAAGRRRTVARSH